MRGRRDGRRDDRDRRQFERPRTARRRRDDDGLYQIWQDNVLEGLGEEYDDRPVAGLFGTLREAQTEFLRFNQGSKLNERWRKFVYTLEENSAAP